MVSSTACHGAGKVWWGAALLGARCTLDLGGGFWHSISAHVMIITGHKPAAGHCAGYQATRRSKADRPGMLGWDPRGGEAIFAHPPPCPHPHSAYLQSSAPSA